MQRSARRRTLLVLDGTRLNQAMQITVLKGCTALNTPLDILASGSHLPAVLLLKLEHTGVDYRLAQVMGSLAEAVQHYLARGRSPCTVVVTHPGCLGAACLARIRAGGHRLLDLSQPPAPGEAPQAAHGPHILPS